MLAGLMSRWMTPAAWQSRTPTRSCSIQFDEPVDRDAPLALQEVGEGLAVEPLEDEERLLLFVPEPEDLRDVRALDPREHDRLPLQSRPHLGAVAVRRLEHLDRDLLPRLPVGSGEDVGRRPAAERPAELEVGEMEGLQNHAG